MHINLKNIEKFINISKIGKNVALNGKIIDVKGNIAQIATDDKLYIIILKKPEVLKNKTVVELLFSNREVTTPQNYFQGHSTEERHIEAKLLFVVDIKDFVSKNMIESPTFGQKDIVGQKDMVSSIPLFLFFQDSTAKVLASLEPSEINTLFEDFKELFEQFFEKKLADNVKTAELEIFRKSLSEFLLRIKKNLATFLSFPKKIRLDILRLYLNLEKGKSNQETKDKKKLASFKNIEPEKEYENVKLIKQSKVKPSELPNVPEDIALAKKDFSSENNYKVLGYSDNSINNTSNDTKPIEEKNNNQLNTSEESKEYSRHQLKNPEIIETFSKSYKQLQNKGMNELKSHKNSEIKMLVKLLKFSLSTFNPKILKRIKKPTSPRIEMKIGMNLNHLEKSSGESVKKLENSYFENLSLKEIYESDLSEFSEPKEPNMKSSEEEQINSENVSENRLNQLMEKKEHQVLEKPKSTELITERIFKDFKFALLKHMNEKDVDRVISMLKKTIEAVNIIVEKVGISGDNKRKQSILKDSLIILKNEIEKRLVGESNSIEKVKNIIDDFTERILEKQFEKFKEESKEFFLEIDEKKILYSKIINYLSGFSGIHSFFLDFGEIAGRIDLIDEKLDPKIKKGFRLIFDLKLQNLGKVLLDIIISFKEVDVRLFVEEKAKELFDKNLENFRSLFNEEGYNLRSFFVFDIKESKILRDERLSLLSGSEGNYNWIA